MGRATSTCASACECEREFLAGLGLPQFKLSLMICLPGGTGPEALVHAKVHATLFRVSWFIESVWVRRHTLL